jgi:recA bacterial DNA recombination protein
MANTALAASVQTLSRLAARFEIRSGTPGLWALSRGGITEILGEASSGRTAMAQWMLANATRGGEVAAIVDCDDAFDPGSARKAGLDLAKLLWVQCGHRLEIALKATDLILHSGGFGMVVLDLGDMLSSALQRVPGSYWYRFQRAVEHTPSALVIVARQPVARSCSIRQIEFQQQRLSWRGQPPFQTIERLDLAATSRKPMNGIPLAVEARG